MKLLYQNRTGVFHKRAKLSGARLDCCRLTIPAREALEAFGAAVSPADPPHLLESGKWVMSSAPHWRVALGTLCPPGLIAAQQVGVSHAICIRLDIEPEWPNEIPATWPQLDLTPCPRCRSALVWYEAGYVPGYRVCAGPQHHHWLAR